MIFGGISPVGKEKAEKTRKRIFRLFLLLLLLITACSAAPVHRIDHNAAIRLIPQIPFHPQDDFQCGPASLAAVLNFYGTDVTPAQIAAKIFSATARGTLDWDMVFFAESHGFKVRRYAGTEEDVRNNVEKGKPLIALVDYGYWVYEKRHFLVITGYYREGFIVNSGDMQQLFLPRDEFLKVWKKAGFLTLLIERP